MLFEVLRGGRTRIKVYTLCDIEMETTYLDVTQKDDISHCLDLRKFRFTVTKGTKLDAVVVGVHLVQVWVLDGAGEHPVY